MSWGGVDLVLRKNNIHDFALQMPPQEYDCIVERIKEDLFGTHVLAFHGFKPTPTALLMQEAITTR